VVVHEWRLMRVLGARTPNGSDYDASVNRS